jgi:hypothetical protein
MKKYILGLILAVCFFASQAQVSFGVKGGLNLNYLLFQYEGMHLSSETESNTGFHLGGYLQIPLGKKLSLQPELQFSRRGFGNINLDYLEFPLLISYAPFKAIQFEMGGNVSSQQSQKLFYSEYERGFDLGIIGGLRYNLPKGFFISSRYYFGLSPAHSVDLRKAFRSIDPNDPLLSQGSWTLDTFNRNIQFSIGYKIK